MLVSLFLLRLQLRRTGVGVYVENLVPFLGQPACGVRENCSFSTICWRRIGGNQTLWNQFGVDELGLFHFLGVLVGQRVVCEMTAQREVLWWWRLCLRCAVLCVPARNVARCHGADPFHQPKEIIAPTPKPVALVLSGDLIPHLLKLYVRFTMLERVLGISVNHELRTSCAPVVGHRAAIFAQVGVDARKHHSPVIAPQVRVQLLQ